MKILSKVIVYSVMGLAVAELGGTYYISMQTEKKFRELQSLLNKNPAFSVEIVDYKNKLFTSEATTVINSKQLKFKNPIHIKHAIFNGPIIFKATPEKPIDFQFAIIKSTPEISPNIQVPFVATTVIDFQNNIESIVAGAAYRIEEQGITVNGAQWSANYKLTKMPKAIKGELLIPETNTEYMGMPVTIKDIEFHFDHAQQGDNWMGGSSFSLKSIAGADQIFEVNDFKVQEKRTSKNHLVDMVWALELVKASFLGEVYGPMSVSIKIENIDTSALDNLSTDGTKYDKNAEQNALAKLLTHKPRIVIENTSITLPQGNIHLNAAFSVGGIRANGQAGRGMWTDSLEGNLNVVVPKPILEELLAMNLKPLLEFSNDYKNLDNDQKKQALNQQIQLKINKLKQSGNLIEREKEYEINIVVKEGKLVSSNPQVAEELAVPSNPSAPANASGLTEEGVPAKSLVPNPAAPASSSNVTKEVPPVPSISNPLAPAASLAPANPSVSPEQSAPMQLPAEKPGVTEKLSIPSEQPAPVNAPAVTR